MVKPGLESRSLNILSTIKYALWHTGSFRMGQRPIIASGMRETSCDQIECPLGARERGHELRLSEQRRDRK